VSETDILAELTKIFREIFGDDTIVLTPETTADDVEGWDSFNHINILVATEVRFGIKFQTAEIEGMRNVGELVHLIGEKIGKAPSR
jgi:acyl carrier protein